MNHAQVNALPEPIRSRYIRIDAMLLGCLGPMEPKARHRMLVGMAVLMTDENIDHVSRVLAGEVLAEPTLPCHNEVSNEERT